MSLIDAAINYERARQDLNTTKKEFLEKWPLDCKHQEYGNMKAVNCIGKALSEWEPEFQYDHADFDSKMEWAMNQEEGYLCHGCMNLLNYREIVKQKKAAFGVQKRRVSHNAKVEIKKLNSTGDTE